MVIALHFIPLTLGSNFIKTYLEYSLKYFSGGVSILMPHYALFCRDVITLALSPQCGYDRKLLPHTLVLLFPTLPHIPVGGGQLLQTTGA